MARDCHILKLHGGARHSGCDDQSQLAAVCSIWRAQRGRKLWVFVLRNTQDEAEIGTDWAAEENLKPLIALIQGRL